MMVPFNTNLMKLEFVAAQMMGQLVQPLLNVAVTRCLTSMRFQNVPKTVEDFVRKMSSSVKNVVVLEEIVIPTRFGHPQVGTSSLSNVICLNEISLLLYLDNLIALIHLT